MSVVGVTSPITALAAFWDNSALVRSSAKPDCSPARSAPRDACLACTTTSSIRMLIKLAPQHHSVLAILALANPMMCPFFMALIACSSYSTGSHLEISNMLSQFRLPGAALLVLCCHQVQARSSGGQL